MWLGGVFTANMTGNTVLLAIAVGQGHGADAARAAVALGGFIAGAAVASIVPPAAAGLTVEAVALAALVVTGTWAGVGHLPLIALGAAAMGAQAGTVRRHNPTGVNVTFITGTLAKLVGGFVARIAFDRRPASPDGRPDPALPGLVWSLYAVGGLTGALVAGPWHAAGFTVPAAGALTGALLARARASA